MLLLLLLFWLMTSLAVLVVTANYQSEHFGSRLLGQANLIFLLLVKIKIGEGGGRREAFSVIVFAGRYTRW